MKDVRDLYGTRRGHLAFIVGTGPSIENAENKLRTVPDKVYRIAVNAAIERVPADYWFWIDGGAYLKSKDHPNAKAAIRVGVEQFEHLYDEDTYIWERALGCQQTPCPILRINEAIANRDHWLPKQVMLVDASKYDSEPGKLPVEKTTIGRELELNHDLHKWLEDKKVDKWRA